MLEFTPIDSIFAQRLTGSQICIRGWIYRRSVVGGKAFIRVRDSTGVIQVVVDASRFGEELVNYLKNIGLEASV
ncbi:MAG: OB-fold nucleic acid binding domain-containing protein, partial [Thermosphaera sp.]